MDPGYYVAAGSLKARAFQLEVVANNLANAATVGYKPDQAFFAVFNKAAGSGRKLPLSGYLNDGVVFAETGVVTEQGNLRATGRPLDLAIEGNAFLAVQTPAGIRVTRDGRVQMGVDGQLQAADGSPLLGKNGQPIKVDPKNGIISISVDGSVSQKGQVLGQLDLKAYEKPGALKRTGALRFDPTGAKEAPVKGTVTQGHLEQSAVDSASTMVEMIRLNRLYELSLKVASTLTNDLDSRSINDVAISR
ncbi:MAG: flagellar hook-basal body protein [Geothrix sp.]|uniref:Flagellar hook-basal body protein n=1 Tax=Candidatus Geothrix odensensis TaxID=2954440 RepID=A0A936F3Y2_9BACT|nr:flagellar hook-basal body protein [Holophagaceae bacterium]MBK8572657.1 flagellar hook-basal body protein [Candidatus Geothrix odensensis]MCC6514065.1 flagellar hook-basal body protein [Geothrix sp.]